MTMKSCKQAVALASLTSAQNAKRAGATRITSLLRDGSLSVLATVTITSGSVVASITWEVSMDNSTFYRLYDSNDAAVTTITATDTRAMECPKSAMGWPYVRACATLSGAATAGTDLTQLDYHFRPVE